MSTNSPPKYSKKLNDIEKKKRRVPWVLRRDVHEQTETVYETKGAPPVDYFAQKRIENVIKYVEGFFVKDKRKILQIIRQTCKTPGMFIPEYGITGGEMALGHVLIDRQRKKN